MAELTNVNFDIDSLNEEDLFEDASAEEQERLKKVHKAQQFEQDPFNTIERIKVNATSIALTIKGEQGPVNALEFTHVYDPETGKLKESPTLIALRFHLIKPRYGMLQYDANQKKVMCSSIAAFPVDGEQYNNFTDLPTERAIKYTCEYKEAGDPSPDKPSRELIEEGLYGSKKMFCADCVHRQEHKYDLPEEADVKDKKVSCSPVGDMPVVLTDLCFKRVDARTRKASYFWVPVTELYEQDEQGNDIPVFKQLNAKEEIDQAANYPIYRITPSTGMMTRNTTSRGGLMILNQGNIAEAEKKADGHGLAPADVAAIADYMREMSQTTLDDGKPWTMATRLKPLGEGLHNLYRGKHEMWFDAWASPSQGIGSTQRGCAMRHSDESQEKTAAELKKETGFALLNFYKYLATQVEEKGINVRKPFTPQETLEAKSTPSLAPSENGNGKEKTLETSVSAEDTELFAGNPRK